MDCNGLAYGCKSAGTVMQAGRPSAPQIAPSNSKSDPMRTQRVEINEGHMVPRDRPVMNGVTQLSVTSPHALRHSPTTRSSSSSIMEAQLYAFFLAHIKSLAILKLVAQQSSQGPRTQGCSHKSRREASAKGNQGRPHQDHFGEPCRL